MDDIYTIPTTMKETALRTVLGHLTCNQNVSSDDDKSASLRALLFAQAIRTSHVGQLDGLSKSPDTPFSNLKLLTRVASMEESIPSRKELFPNCTVDGILGSFTNELDKSIEANIRQASSREGNKENCIDLRKRHGKFRRCCSENGAKISPVKTVPTGKTTKVTKSAKTTWRKYPTSLDYPVMSSPGNLVLDNCGFSITDGVCALESGELSRKNKSLGMLCEKFLEHFPLDVSVLETPRRMIIDEVASALGTERRRVYDIINVLESLNMAGRVQKNVYQWNGRLNLEATLGRLKALAIKNGFDVNVRSCRSSTVDFKSSPRKLLPKPLDVHINSPSVETVTDTVIGDNRKQKSLGILCQKFLMLFLVSPEDHVLSLDTATRILFNDTLGVNEPSHPRSRRLYDVANVLTSLRLVKRDHAARAFVYIGPTVTEVPVADDTITSVRETRQSLLSTPLNQTNAIMLGETGNHEVTPSESVLPATIGFKRLQPRKINTDSLPNLTVLKKPRLSRMMSEGLPQMQPLQSELRPHMVRHPSLQEICQVASIEREKLWKEEQIVTIPTIATSLLRKRLTSNSGRVPIALTFQKHEVSPNLTSHPDNWSSKKIIPNQPFSKEKCDSEVTNNCSIQMKFETNSELEVKKSNQSMHMTPSFHSASAVTRLIMPGKQGAGTSKPTIIVMCPNKGNHNSLMEMNMHSPIDMVRPVGSIVKSYSNPQGISSSVNLQENMFNMERDKNEDLTTVGNKIRGMENIFKVTPRLIQMPTRHIGNESLRMVNIENKSSLETSQSPVIKVITKSPSTNQTVMTVLPTPSPKGNVYVNKAQEDASSGMSMNNIQVQLRSGSLTRALRSQPYRVITKVSSNIQNVHQQPSQNLFAAAACLKTPANFTPKQRTTVVRCSSESSLGASHTHHVSVISSNLSTQPHSCDNSRKSIKDFSLPVPYRSLSTRKVRASSQSSCENSNGLILASFKESYFSTSNPESELDKIFGDSFRFIRPSVFKSSK